MDHTHLHGREAHSHPQGRHGGWGSIHHHVTLTLGRTSRPPKRGPVAVWPTVCTCDAAIIDHSNALPCGVQS